MAHETRLARADEVAVGDKINVEYATGRELDFVVLDIERVGTTLNLLINFFGHDELITKDAAETVVRTRYSA